MPTVHSSKARTDRYTFGLLVPAPTRSGKKIDKSQPRDKDDPLFCKKGETYYYWQFRTGGKNFSTTYPRQSQLTKSEFLISVYVIQEVLESLNPEDYVGGGLGEYKDELLGEVEAIKDDLENKKSNMEQYEGLANSPVFELISERLDAVEGWYDELDNVDVDYDEKGIEQEAQEEAIDEEGFDDLTQGELDAIVAEKKHQKEVEKIDEIISDLQECSCDL